MVAQPDIQADTQVIRQHLDHLTERWHELGEDCLLEMVFLSADNVAKVRQVNHYTPDANGIALAVDDARTWNKSGNNVYATVNPVSASNRPAPSKRASAEHIIASFFQFADADDQQAADNIRTFAGPKPTFNVITGQTPCVRPHVYWQLEEPTRNLSAWSDTQRAIAATLKTDSVIDPPRIMRVAGTVNWPKPQKQEKGYIPELTLLHIHADRDPIPSERMARAFAGATAATDSPFSIDTGHQGKTTADYADMLSRARTDGQKHTGVRDFAATLAGQGVNRAMAEALIQQVCPVWDENVEDLINSAYQKYYNPSDHAVPTFDAPEKKVAALEWFDEIEPSLTDAYLVKDVLGAATMSVVYGPSNSGKTFFALDLAYHIAASPKWRDMRVTPSAVLYLAAEGGRGVANRIVALKQATGASGVPFALRRAGMDLLHAEADLNAVYELAQEVQSAAPDRPLMIVIDTLSRVMAGGDENSAADMTALIRNIDAIREATGAHIMLVHHTGKDAARGARGHSSLRAATDTEIEVQNEDGQRAAMVTKQRDYQGGEVFAFALKGVELGKDQDGDPVTSCVVEVTDSEEFKAAKKAGKGRGKNQQIIMDTFDQMVGEGMGKANPGGVGMPEAGQFWAVDLQELRRLSQGKMAGDNAARLFRQAWDALTARDGLFCTGDNLAWRIDRRKK